MDQESLGQAGAGPGLGRPTNLSLLSGPQEPPLLEVTLGELLDTQATLYGDKTAVVCSADRVRVTYAQLQRSSQVLANALLANGIQPGDRIAIMAGNCLEYVELFFAVGQVGAILVVLNNTYTRVELENALRYSQCKFLFTTLKIGPKDNSAMIRAVASRASGPRALGLERIILLRHPARLSAEGYTTFPEFIGESQPGQKIDEFLENRRGGTHEICNLQFTSGTTGTPKAAALTHHNVINNARFVGDRMGLKESDILCCPPPLFHCFGLVLGLLAVIAKGATIVFPSETFHAAAVVAAVVEEKCTALHGVPAMWSAEMDLVTGEHDFSRLRTGIAAGSSTTRQMMHDIREKLCLDQVTNTYGMTETSPASFMTSWNDDLERRLSTVGRILPHTVAKIVDLQGNIVPLGHRGELCISGYLLQAGYWNNPAKTAEVMRKGEGGVLWMHTGDEACFDEEGYCRITGRIKDMIIRGGENIFPLEIEERLMEHPSISQASVVGLKDHKFGEIVAAFLQMNSGVDRRLEDAQVRSWVRAVLGWHKAPLHVFFLGDPGVGDEFPLTGSGKVKKHLLRDLGNDLLQQRKSKL